MSMQRTRSESDRNHERSGATRVYRRKLQKRLLHHKIQLDDLESAKKVFQSSSQVLNIKILIICYNFIGHGTIYITNFTDF